MEEAKNVEIQANENSNIAMDEKVTANETKLLAKQELKRAKTREILVQNEIELARIRKRLAEKSKKFIERKERVKDMLKFSGENIRAEKNQAIYNERIAEIQKEVAQIQRKISKVETEIADLNVKFANTKLDNAKGRNILAKKQFVYVKLVNNNAPSEKITKAKEVYLKQENDLTKFETDTIEINKHTVEKQNKLADLKKELSVKLAEREKVRPIETNI